MNNEVWKTYPEFPFVEVSTFGRVRTLDRVTSSEKGTYFVKGLILKPFGSGTGYMKVGIQIGGKRTNKYVHRLVAQTFIPNPDNLPDVNHKDCDRKNNKVENLEFCTASYNRQYQEKFGDAKGLPLFVINLKTLEILHFRSQIEASRALGVSTPSINNAIKGKIKQAGGYWFKEDDGNGIEIDRDKLNSIANGMLFRGGVFAVNLNTLEVSSFKSQHEASREIGVYTSNISKVIKNKYKQTGGYWFVSDDKHAVEATRNKFGDIVAHKVEQLIEQQWLHDFINEMRPA